jgi:hypothetical protein
MFSFPVMTIGIVFEFALRNIPNDYTFKKEYLENNVHQIEMLVLGNSHSYYSLNPQMIKQYKCFNAAYISQSIDYDNELLLYYKNEWKSLKYIVLPIDYLSMYTTLGQSVEAWREKNYNIYYDFENALLDLDHFEIFNGNSKIERLKRYYIHDVNNISCNALGWGNNYVGNHIDKLDHTGWEAALRHTATNQSCVGKNLKALKSILSFAKQRHIEVVLYTSPALRSYYTHFEPKQWQHTLMLIKDLVKQNTHVRYYNLMNHPDFNQSHFYDADHLNHSGAIRFTPLLDSLVQLKK